MSKLVIIAENLSATRRGLLTGCSEGSQASAQTPGPISATIGFGLLPLSASGRRLRRRRRAALLRPRESSLGARTALSGSARPGTAPAVGGAPVGRGGCGAALPAPGFSRTAPWSFWCRQIHRRRDRCIVANATPRKNPTWPSVLRSALVASSQAVLPPRGALPAVMSDNFTSGGLPTSISADVANSFRLDS